jgi:hypothetical protein
VKPNTKLLIAPIQGVGREHPLSVEKLFPVLAVYRAKSVDEALKVCVDVNHAGGLGHTAVIFSRNDEIIRKFGEVINAGRIIVNSPGSIGALGGVYNDLVPTFSFGCGTGGGNSTTDNVNIYHYLNIKRVARRTPSPYVVPSSQSDLFQPERGGESAQFPSRSTIIVTNPAPGADRPRRHCPALHSAGDPRPRLGHSRCGARGQGGHARSGGAQFLQGGPDHRAGRRVGDRRGQDHEAQVRVAGGRPGRTGRARSWISASAWSSTRPRKSTGRG